MPDLKTPATTASAAQSGSVRKQRLARSRDALLSSAIELFAQFGFEGTSMRAVATRAGVNHGMIRHIFGAKEELWQEAVAFLFERASSEMEVVDSDKPPRARFVDLIHTYVRYCARHPEHARLMIQLSIVDGPELDWMSNTFIRDRHRHAVPLIEELKATGYLPQVETSSILFSLVASCQMIFVLAPEVLKTTGRDMTDRDEIKKHADAVVAMFLLDP